MEMLVICSYLNPSFEVLLSAAGSACGAVFERVSAGDARSKDANQWLDPFSGYLGKGHYPANTWPCAELHFSHGYASLEPRPFKEHCCNQMFNQNQLARRVGGQLYSIPQSLRHSLEG